MLKLVIISVIFSVLAGLTIKKVTDWMETDREISWTEFGIGSTLITLVIVPLTVWVGWHSAINNMVRYNEFWNGWEVAAQVDETTCTKNGSCRHTYDCDPYEHTHSTTSTDANGNTTTSYYTETHWNSCPYMTREYDYYVTTTLPDDAASYRIGGTRWAENPTLWSGWGDGDRGGIPDVPRGAPKQWLEAKARIDRDDNGPVTARFQYDNFILASQSTILQQYSDSIKRYRKAKQLPDVTSPSDDIHHYYHADKVYPVLALDNERKWQQSLSRLNAALGTDLQGDLHVVIVPEAIEAENYTLSLQAYWGSPKMGKDALSKNGIVLILGSDGQHVKWSRAFTGMPVGNTETMTQLESAVLDKQLDPDILFGHPLVDLSRKKPTIIHTDGVVERALWGIGTGTKFERICMGCEGKGDKGVGYLYLKEELQPGGGAKFLMAFIASLLSMLLWGGALALGTRTEFTHQRTTYRW